MSEQKELTPEQIREFIGYMTKIKENQARHERLMAKGGSIRVTAKEFRLLFHVLEIFKEQNQAIMRGEKPKLLSDFMAGCYVVDLWPLMQDKL